MSGLFERARSVYAAETARAILLMAAVCGVMTTSSAAVAASPRATVTVAAANSAEESKAAAGLVCDGLGDQEEIYKALHRLPEPGGTVVLMEGTYDIRKVQGQLGGVIIDRSNVTLAGQGPNTKLILAPDQNTNVIRIIGHGVGHITIRGLWVDQNRDENPENSGDPDVSHDRFEYCGIKAFCEVPGKYGPSCHDITIMNCHVLNASRLGIMLEGRNMRVINNVLGNAFSDSVEILEGPGIIQGNIVDITDKTHVAIGSDRGGSILMTDNIVTVREGATLDIGFRSWADSQRHVIANNILRVEEGGTIGRALMEVRGYATTVTGNVVQTSDATTRTPLWITGANAIVTGNFFENVELVVADETGSGKPVVVNNNLLVNSVVTHEKGTLITEPQPLQDALEAAPQSERP